MPTSTKATSSRIAVAISDDRMQASIQLNQSNDKSPIVLSEVLDALDRAGVVRDDAVSQRAVEFVRLASKPEHGKGSLVRIQSPPRR